MAKIKTRDAVKGTIRQLDKASVAADRMKRAYVQTKEKAETSTHAAESNPEEYASDRISAGAENLTHETAYRAKQVGHKAEEKVKGKIRKSFEDRETPSTSQEKKNPVKTRETRAEKAGKESAKHRSGNVAKRGMTEQQSQIEPRGPRSSYPQAGGKSANTVKAEAHSPTHNTVMPRTEKTSTTRAVEQGRARAIKTAHEKRVEPTTRIQAHGRQVSHAVEPAQKSIKETARSAGRKTIKTTEKAAAKTAQKGVKTAERTAKTAIKTSKEAAKMTERAARASAKAAQKAAQAARATAKAVAAGVKAAVKATIAAVKAIIAAVKGLVAAIATGGWVAVVIIVVLMLVALIACSVFGIFFSGETSTPNTVSLPQAIADVNSKYNDRLETIQAGSYDGIVLSGEHADWIDVVAVFSARHTTSSTDQVDVAVLDADRQSKLETVFWDMTEVGSEVESIYHPDSDPEDEEDDSWTEYILHIDITAKSADDMRTVYSFTTEQNEALDLILAQRPTLESVIQSLSIPDTRTRAILSALPGDLPASRRNAVKTALSLVGKVNYFWGGKSYVTGWDSRWGQTTLVFSDGSTTTGKYRPFGLDCSGFIDWTLRNAGLPSDGHWYVGTNLTAVSEADALPGDLALFPGEYHVGMVVGRNESGQLLICHCNARDNNVSVTDYSTTGFTQLGRPAIY